LAEQFEDAGELRFHLAPPLLSRPGPDGRPRKMSFGPWMVSAFRTLAKLRRIRGKWFDPFGHTAERKIERALANEYEALLRDTLLPALDAKNHAAALALAKLPEKIRGYGHVKLANVGMARAQQADLLRRFASGESPAASGAAPAKPRKVIAISEL
jgi:indolepyruvate ferredoxin oxidoreductase